MQKLNRLFSDTRTGFWSASTLLTSAVAMLMCAGGPAGCCGGGGAAALPAAPMLPGACSKKQEMAQASSLLAGLLDWKLSQSTKAKLGTNPMAWLPNSCTIISYALEMRATKNSTEKCARHRGARAVPACMMLRQIMRLVREGCHCSPCPLVLSLPRP
jgi:hypothetical protein